jgi:phosphoserine aminotransferase
MYKYNFSAGPAKINESVLKIAKENILEYNSEGISILELSHRSTSFQDILNITKDNLRKLLGIPPNFKILLLQGGATFQNTFIGNNIDRSKQLSNLVTGTWGNKSYEDMQKIRSTTKINIESGKIEEFLEQSNKKEFTTSELLHLTSNETIEGIQIRNFNQINQDLILDCSSDIGSYKFDWDNVAYLYAGAQKNLGIPGVTVCIIRDDFINQNENPTYLNLKKLVDKDSLLNTPPTFSIYMLKLVTEWMLQKGGIDYFEKQSIENSTVVYSLLEKYNPYVSLPVGEYSRSRMNIVFNFKNLNHEETFINKSLENNIIGIKGHRSVGGIRISLYNSVDKNSLQYLLDFMDLYFKEL